MTLHVHLRLVPSCGRLVRLCSATAVWLRRLGVLVEAAPGAGWLRQYDGRWLHWFRCSCIRRGPAARPPALPLASPAERSERLGLGAGHGPTLLQEEGGQVYYAATVAPFVVVPGDHFR